MQDPTAIPSDLISGNQDEYQLTEPSEARPSGEGWKVPVPENNADVSLDNRPTLTIDLTPMEELTGEEEEPSYLEEITLTTGNVKDFVIYVRVREDFLDEVPEGSVLDDGVYTIPIPVGPVGDDGTLIVAIGAKVDEVVIVLASPVDDDVPYSLNVEVLACVEYSTTGTTASTLAFETTGATSSSRTVTEAVSTTETVPTETTASTKGPTAIVSITSGPISSITSKS